MNTATNKIVTAQPYDARQCPICDTWIFTQAPPFAEDDPTKTLRDILHYEREHGTPEELSGTCVLFPFFTYNDVPVQAVRERV